jgi:serine/threonine protein kinase
MPPLAAGEDELERFNNSFLEAACAARLMIAQLMPTFERLNGSIAYHRDVNARNLLVHSPLDASADDRNGPLPVDVSTLEFTILDFGSSTEARAWLGTGEGSWQVENPTGDARYWGPASWVRFLGGPQALSIEASLLRQYTRRLDIFALAVCTLELMVKLHSVDFPSEASLRNLPESRGPEVQLAQSVWRAHGSWNAYWKIAVTSFDRLAEYSRLSCLGDQAQALQVWQSLGAGQIPETMSQKLHELCGDLHYLAEVCRVQRLPGSPNGSWVQVGATLSGLLDMMHFNGALEWTELIQRVGPPVLPKRLGPPAAGSQWPVRVDEAKGNVANQGQQAGVAQLDASRQQQPDGLAQGNGAGNSLSVPAAASAGSGQVPLIKSFAMADATAEASSPATEQQAAVPSSISPGSGYVGTEQMLIPEFKSSSPGPLVAADNDVALVQPVLEEPPLFSSETSPLGRNVPFVGLEAPASASMDMSNVHFSPVSRQRAVPASSTHGEFAVPPPFAHSPMQASPQGLLGSLQNSYQKNRENFEVYEDPKVKQDTYSSPTKGLQAGQSPGSFPNNAGSTRENTRVFEHAEEREHEALRILRQVESEVRTLKRWYTEAIEAMRSPNPFPPGDGL